MKSHLTKQRVQVDTTFVAHQCIGSKVRKLNRVLTRLYDDAIRHLGVTVGQMNILVQANELANTTGVARPSELGHRIRMDISTLSRNVNRLRGKGFLEILPDDDDGRAQQLRLTAKAYDLLRRGTAPWKKAQKKANDLLGDRGVALIDRMDQRIDAQG